MTTPYDKTALSDTASDPARSIEDHDEAYCSACNQSFPLELEICPNDGARLIKLKASRDALLGRVFENRYEVRAQLGHGGMGTVYRAHQLSVDREVAIKVIHPKVASDRGVIKRFLREARLASRLSQPNIVNVYDFGQTEDGILYLVMELLRGQTLARELEAKGALPIRRVTTIARQLCDALEVAHAQGIVHRDLKPSNIVILDEPPGRDLVKVLDFGLAKSLVADTTSLTTNSDALLGTPLYMPPEQIGGTANDARADLYSLGCILHHMLRGTPPFVRETVNAVLSAHMHEKPPALPSSVPPRFARMIERMMEKDPALRPRSAAEVRAAIEMGDDEHAAMGYSPTDPSMPAHPAPATPLETPPRGRGGWIVGGVAAAVLVAGGAYVATRSSTPVVIPDARTAQPVAADAQIPTPPVAHILDAAVTTPGDAAAAHPHVGPAPVPHVARDAGAVVEPADAPPPVKPPPVKPPIDAPPSIDFIH